MENKSKLDVAREKINEIDRQMCELFLVVACLFPKLEVHKIAVLMCSESTQDSWSSLAKIVC